MRHTAGFAADGGKSKLVGSQPVPSQPSPGLGMKGLLLLKWLVRCCALADRPWAECPQAAPLVLASESAVEVDEGYMGHAAPADKGFLDETAGAAAFHEFNGQLCAPSHWMLPWRQKPKAPFCRAACQVTVGDPLEPTRRSSIRAWRLAVYRALQHALKVRQATRRNSLRLCMIPDLGCCIPSCAPSPTHSR
jgi:hypothetical protein